MEFGFWNENHTIWRDEGLPPGFDVHENLEERFRNYPCEE